MRLREEHSYMIPVIDLFAGPGGLGEGFSSLRQDDGSPVFQIVMSVEKDDQAHKTLRLRSFLRKIYASNGEIIPRQYLQFMQTHNEEKLSELIEKYPTEWEAANN